MKQRIIQPGAMTIDEAANYVSLSKATVKNLIHKGDFPKPRQLAGKRVGILVREVNEWLETRPVSNQLPPPNTSRNAVV
ncbi:helix-turn-helix transcriptional regulator [Methylomonas sp. MgM2]